MDSPDRKPPSVPQRRGFDGWLVEHMSIRHMPGSEPLSDYDPAGHGWSDFIVRLIEWLLVGLASVGILLGVLFILTRV